MLIEDQYTQRMTLLNPNVLSISWRQGRRKNPVKLDGLLLSKFDEFEETGKLWLPNTTQEPQISVRSMTTDPESKITLIQPFSRTRPHSFSILAQILSFPGTHPGSTIFR